LHRVVVPGTGCEVVDTPRFRVEIRLNGVRAAGRSIAVLELAIDGHGAELLEQRGEPTEGQRSFVVPSLAAPRQESLLHMIGVLLRREHGAGCVWTHGSEPMRGRLEPLAFARIEDHLDLRPCGAITSRPLRFR